MAQVHLENVSQEPQTIYSDEGNRYTLKALDDRKFDDAIAEKFLAERSGLVRRFTASVMPILLPGEREAWIANQTGSPFLPVEFSKMVYEKDQPKEVKVPNLNRIPTVLNWSMPVGQGQDPYGRFQVDADAKDFNLLPLKLSLRPGHRAKCSSAVREFILQQDAQAGEFHTGKTIISRPPSAFEPDESWNLPEMVFYATIVDKNGFSEQAMNILIKDLCDGERPTPSYLKEHPAVEEEIRHAVYKRLCYRLHDPTFSLPTKKYFENAYAQAQAKARGSQQIGTASDSPSA